MFSLISVVLNIITQMRVLELKNKNKCYHRIDNFSMVLVTAKIGWRLGTKAKRKTMVCMEGVT